MIRQKNIKKERDKIIADNKTLNHKVESLEKEYKRKSNNLDFDYNERKNELEKEFKNKEFDIEYKYKYKIKSLEKENNHLHQLLDKFKETLGKFIHWICKNFTMSSDEKSLIMNFEKETNTYLDPERQLQKEDRKNDIDMEL